MSKTSEAIDALFAALIDEYGPNVLELLLSGAMKEQVSPSEIASPPEKPPTEEAKPGV